MDCLVESRSLNAPGKYLEKLSNGIRPTTVILLATYFIKYFTLSSLSSYSAHRLLLVFKPFSHSVVIRAVIGHS